MAFGPKDLEQTQSQSEHARSETRIHPFIWPESQRMEDQQDAANRMVRKHAAERPTPQQDAASPEPPQAPAKRELTFTKDRERGNYATLKQEHADATGRDDASKDQEPPAKRELTFAKDRDRPSHYAELKQAHAEQTPKNQDHGLKFVKDQSRDPDLER